MRAISRGLAANIEAQATTIARAVHTTTPELPAWLLPDTGGACRELLSISYRCLLTPDARNDEDDLRRVARRFVLIGLGEDVVVHVVRLALQQISATLHEQRQVAPRATSDFFDAVARISGATFTRAEGVNEVLAIGYSEEQHRRATSGEAQRSAAACAVLSGEIYDAAQATRNLGYPVDGDHIAFIVWGVNGRAEPAELRAAARDIQLELGGGKLLAVARGAATLLCWVHLPSPTTSAGGDRLPLASVPDGVRIAVGERHRDIDGFRRSHTEAQHARRVATLTRCPSGRRTRFADVALLVLLSADLKAARRFVCAQLGGLESSDRETQQIAETLATYYEEGSHQMRTAERLQIHAKTVRYRTRRAEEMLGHSIEERRLETGSALALLQMMRSLDDENVSDAWNELSSVPIS